jgi:single-stranded-DNA-specific exonuclease
LIVLLLTSDDPDEIAALVDRFLAANVERQQATRGLLEQALLQVDPENDTVLVAQLTLPIGLAGLVAGQMSQRFHRPAIILDQRGGGSGRSVPGVSLIDLLGEYKSWCTAGGHHAACGVKHVKHPTEFREAIRHHPIAPEMLADTLVIERSARLADLSAAAFTDLERLGPFGEGQRTPLWLVRDVHLVNERVVGTDHYACDLLDDEGVRRRAIWFGAAHMSGKYTRADAVVELEFDTYHGDANLLIRDLGAPGAHPL